MKIKKLIMATVLFVPATMLALAQSGPQSQEPKAAPDQPEMRGGIILEARTAEFTVDSIDAKTRDVLLLRTDGSKMTYRCGPDVRNFDQIKVGDKVTATVAQELALVLVKGEVPPAAGTATVLVRAPKGAKPGGKIVDTIGFTAKVLKVHSKHREVTLQMVDGTSKTVKVGPDINLDNVNEGDDVGVRLTRAFAIDVTGPQLVGEAPAK
jgi:hypothetical protein